MNLAIRFGVNLSVPNLEKDLAKAESACAWVYKPSKEGKYRGWSAIALHSMKGALGLEGVNGHVSEWHAHQCRLTSVAMQCPYFLKIIEKFASPKLRVRLMRLEPGGEIGMHSDRLYGWHMPILRLHVPITTNARVTTEIAGRQIDMAPGELWYLETTEKHRVNNFGSTARVHLVLDFVNSEQLLAGFREIEWTSVIESR